MNNNLNKKSRIFSSSNLLISIGILLVIFPIIRNGANEEYGFIAVLNSIEIGEIYALAILFLSIILDITFFKKGHERIDALKTYAIGFPLAIFLIYNWYTANFVTLIFGLILIFVASYFGCLIYKKSKSKVKS